jgi:hypothetical protein
MVLSTNSPRDLNIIHLSELATTEIQQDEL